MSHHFFSIGHVRSPYNDKFGIPRQSGLVPEARICIELLPQFNADCVRGLADFGYIWLQFVFHATADEGWSPLVRPPRLGGKIKKGVFATRSPHRPNPIGLSLLKLERIETLPHVMLYCSGADLLDGTPVLDIKPYIPFIEAQPNAAAGFADAPPPQLPVIWDTDSRPDDASLILLIEQSIAQDPRPAFHDNPERVYFMTLQGCAIRFRIVNRVAHIIAFSYVNDGQQTENGITQ